MTSLAYREIITSLHRVLKGVSGLGFLVGLPACRLGLAPRRGYHLTKTTPPVFLLIALTL